MTLQQLKYADAVAACGSISEAARRLFVTQPTLTESIRALEEMPDLAGTHFTKNYLSTYYKNKAGLVSHIFADLAG